MSNKVKMSEVHDMYDTLINALKTLDENTKTLKTNIEHLDKHNDFKGETAESIKNYNKSFHIETINRIGNIKKEFEKSFSKSIESFHSDVDTSHSAVLDDESIKTYKDDIKKAANNIEQTRIRMNSNLSSVTDITSAKTIVSTDVKDKNDEFKKHINETLRNFDDFQSSHNLDEVDLLALISPVATLTSKVINMPANRAKISTSSTLISNQYQLYSENNQIVQLKKELEKYQNAVYGVKDGRKYLKAGLDLNKVMLISYIAGDGDVAKGSDLIASGKYRHLGAQKMKLLNGILNTDIENIQGKRLVKAAKFLFDKNNKLPMSQKLRNGLKMLPNYDDKSYEKIIKLKSPNNKSIKGLGEQLFKELKDSSSIKSILNPKKFLKEELNDFKSKNILGKILKTSRTFTKGLGPLGLMLSVATNVVNEKGLQKKIVGSSVDLGAMGIASAVGIGTAFLIGGPLGAGVAIGATMAAGALMDAKLFKGDKSLTDVTKDKVNNLVEKAKRNDVVKTASKALFSSPIEALSIF